MKMRLAFCVCLAVLGLRAGSVGAAERSCAELKDLYSNPPANTKILKIIHNWSDDAQAQANTRQKLLRDQGFGGIVSNVNFDQYMESETHWNAFVRAITNSVAEGANLWLYDECGYPSGNAGGLTMRGHPEWAAEGLLNVTKFYGTASMVELDVPPGKLICATAVPVVDGVPDPSKMVDMRSCVNDKKFKGEVPANHYLSIVTSDYIYEGTHAEGNLFKKMPFINFLSKDATHEFARITYENYAKRFGSDLGKYFEATFTDEPSLMSCFLRTMPYGVLPWISNFPDLFQERCGYDITPFIPLLTLDCLPEGQTAKVKYDFWKSVGDMVAENYFGALKEYCAKYHVPSGGHLIAEEGLGGHIPFYGNFFACARQLDAPSIDVLTSLPGDVPWHIARFMASVADLNGDRLVMSETSDHGQVWRPQGDTRPVYVVSTEEIRGTLGRLIAGGVNRFTSYYSWRDQSDEKIQYLNKWTGRNILLTEGGRQAADVAVLYPVESCWVRYVPSRSWSNDAPGMMAIGGVYQTVSDSLWVGARDFTYVDTRAILESQVCNGKLEHPNGLSWRVIVLPAVDTLPMEAWEKLNKFVERGGIVIATGVLPRNTDKEYPCAAIKDGVESFLGKNPQPFECRYNEAGGGVIFLPFGLESSVSRVIDSVLDRDFAVREANSPLRVTHRTFPDHEVYFVFNDSKDSCTNTVSFASMGSPKVWNPNTGKVTNLPMLDEYVVSLEGWDAAVYTFDRSAERKTFPNQKIIRKYEESPLKLGKPVIGKGEFVKDTFDVKMDDNGEFQECTSVGTVTKSAVDTFLFVYFNEALNMSGIELMSMDVTIPAGQCISTQLLVIVRDTDGGEYIANTGFLLNARIGANTQRVYVPKTAFSLAGWSRDPNGAMDWDKVESFRVGWGGYYGTEGDQVGFSLKNVRLLK